MPDYARLLKRVFEIDLEHYPQCGGELKIITAIEEPAVTACRAGNSVADSEKRYLNFLFAALGVQQSQHFLDFFHRVVKVKSKAQQVAALPAASLQNARYLPIALTSLALDSMSSA